MGNHRVPGKQPLLYKELSYNIIGAAMEVHRGLGSGFLESVYENALAHEFKLRKIPFERQVHLPVSYKSEIVGEYIADMVVNGQIILELKAIQKLNDAHRAQIIHYLSATGLKLGLLINFGGSSLEHQRIVSKRNTT